jgi:hypothetical protein
VGGDVEFYRRRARPARTNQRSEILHGQRAPAHTHQCAGDAAHHLPQEMRRADAEEDQIAFYADLGALDDDYR